MRGAWSPRIALAPPGWYLPPRAARTDADGAGEPENTSRAKPRAAQAAARHGRPRMRRAGRERGRRDPDSAATAVAGRAEVGGKTIFRIQLCLKRLVLRCHPAKQSD